MTVPTHRTLRRGSIFLEAVIAAALVSIILVALFNTLVDSTRHARMVRDQQYALLVAQSQLATVGTSLPLRSGVVRGASGRYRWRIEMAPTAGEGRGKVGQVLRVTVFVRTADGTRDAVSLSSLRATGAPTS